MGRVKLLLPKVLHDGVVKAARRLGISRSEFFRRAVAEHSGKTTDANTPAKPGNNPILATVRQREQERLAMLRGVHYLFGAYERAEVKTEAHEESVLEDLHSVLALVSTGEPLLSAALPELAPRAMAYSIGMASMMNALLIDAVREGLAGQVGEAAAEEIGRGLAGLRVWIDESLDDAMSAKTLEAFQLRALLQRLADDAGEGVDVAELEAVGITPDTTAAKGGAR